MKIRVYSIIFLLFVSINVIFSQNIPDSARMVMSVNLGNITTKINTTPKKIMKDILRNESSSFSVNDYLSFEKLVDSINFNLPISIIFYASSFKYGPDNFSILIPCKDINSLKSALYELMDEYEMNVYRYDGVEYINFGEDGVIGGYKNGIFCISVSSDNYNAINYIKEVFNGYPLKDKSFEELNSRNYDIKVWGDSSLISDYSNEDIIDSRYVRGSSFSFYLNFTEKNAICNFSWHLPNMDLSSIEKRLDDKMIKYINDSSFFATLSLDGRGLVEVLNSYFPSMMREIEYELRNEGYNYDLFDIFAGDAVFSIFGDDNYLLAFSLENQDKFIRLLRNSLSSSSFRSIDNDSYLIEDSDVNIYINDSVACIFDSGVDYRYMENIINNQNKRITGNNLKFLKNNDMTFYINVANIADLIIDEYGGSDEEYIREIITELKYATGSVNIESNKISSNFRIDFRNNAEDFIRNMLSFLDF